MLPWKQDANPIPREIQKYALDAGDAIAGTITSLVAAWNSGDVSAFGAFFKRPIRRQYGEVVCIDPVPRVQSAGS
jgi:hypothetical protein